MSIKVKSLLLTVMMFLAACASPTTAVAPTATSPITQTPWPTPGVTPAPTSIITQVPTNILTPTSTPTFFSPVTPFYQQNSFAIKPTNAIAFAPNGEWFALGGEDGLVRLVKPNGDLINILNGHTSGIQALAITSDRKTLASGSRDTTIRLWNIESGALLKVLDEHTNSVQGLAFSPDNKTLASVSVDATSRLWDVESGTTRAILEGATGAVFSTVYSPDGKTLATAGGDGKIRLWDVSSEPVKVRVLINAQAPIIWSIGFNAAGSKIISGGSDNAIRVWQSSTGELLTTLQGISTVWGVTFLADDRIIASAHEDGFVNIWNIDEKRVWYWYEGHKGRVSSLSLASPWLASVGVDNTVRIWNTTLRTVPPQATPIPSATLDTKLLTQRAIAASQPTSTPRPTAAILSPARELNAGQHIEWSPDGKRLLTSGYGVGIQLYDATSLNQLLNLPKDGVAAFNNSGDQIVLATNEYIRFYDVQTGTETGTQFITPKELRKEPTISHDGQYVVLYGKYDIYIWDTKLNRVVNNFKTVPLKGYPYGNASFSLDNRFFAATFSETPKDNPNLRVNFDGVIRIWDLEKSLLIRELTITEPHPCNGCMLPVALSPDGRLVNYWEISSGKLLSGFTSRYDFQYYEVRSLAFSPDSLMIARSISNEIEVIDSFTGNTLYLMKGKAPALSLAFSPDGKRLVSVDGLSAFVWNLR